jgi:hypothetical protein
MNATPTLMSEAIEPTLFDSLARLVPPDRIRRDVLQDERAGYGEQILAMLSRELIVEFSRSLDATNLSRMMKFVKSFPDEEIVAILSQQLS